MTLLQQAEQSWVDYKASNPHVDPDHAYIMGYLDGKVVGHREGLGLPLKSVFPSPTPQESNKP